MSNTLHLDRPSDWPSSGHWFTNPDGLKNDFLYFKRCTFDAWFKFDWNTHRLEVDYESIRLTGWVYSDVYATRFIDILRVAQPILKSPIYPETIESLRRAIHEFTVIAEELQPVEPLPEANAGTVAETSESLSPEEKGMQLWWRISQELDGTVRALEEYSLIRKMLQPGSNPHEMGHDPSFHTKESVPTTTSTTLHSQNPCEAGVVAAKKSESGGLSPTDIEPVTPDWNGEERVLNFGKYTYRFFPQIRNGVVPKILASFQEDSWKATTLNPIANEEKLKQALRTLNKKCSQIVFSKDGGLIRWSKAPPKAP